jgi:hypothetical protein
VADHSFEQEEAAAHRIVGRHALCPDTLELSLEPGIVSGESLELDVVAHLEGI